MSSQKFEITNPEAIKLINEIKSGQFYAPYKAKIIKYKWFIITPISLLLIFIAISIGKNLAGSTTPIHSLTPQISTTPTVTPTKTSSFDSIRQAIINFNATLPDPALLQLDNKISLDNEPFAE